MKRKYNRITVAERKMIEKWYNNDGLDPKEIAALINVHTATIYRELLRGKQGIFYNAQLAQAHLKRGNAHKVETVSSFTDRGET